MNLIIMLMREFKDPNTLFRNIKLTDRMVELNSILRG